MLLRRYAGSRYLAGVAIEFEVRAQCRACKALARFPLELAGKERPCPTCRATMAVIGERVRVAGEDDAPGFGKEGEVEATGVSGAIFGGGLTAGVAGVALSALTDGKL